MYVTPTGTGQDTMGADLYLPSSWPFFTHSHAYNVIKFDVIMSLQVTADTDEPLKVGKNGILTVTVTETSGKPFKGATVHIKGAGVESEKKTDENGQCTFNVTPTERGRILIEAAAPDLKMKGSYTTVFVDTYVAPPQLEVDPVPPLVGTDTVTINGRTNEGTRVTINGRPVTVAAGGKFTTTVKLIAGMNSIVITASNNAGQSVTKVIKIEAKILPSGILIDPLGEFENVSVVRVRGHVEPGAKSVTVTSSADGSAVPAILANDVFVADVSVLPGDNTITVNVVDSVGKTNSKTTQVYIAKKTTVEVQLGSLIMSVNGMPQKLTVAPQLISGSTMVPFRPIAEAFGVNPSDITYDSNTRTITIAWTDKDATHKLVMVLDKKEATLDGQPITLTAAPKLVTGSTLVPLRFIEYLGVSVDWNAQTRSAVLNKRQ